MRLLLWQATALAAATGAASPSSPPNVVIILADDMGFGDLGVNSAAQASETPFLDDLAASGMNFLDMHSGSSVCTPARAALLTGRQGERMGMTSNFGEASLFGLNKAELTLAELLKSGGGYDTAMLGKWHLGHTAPFQPRSRGFDAWLGIPYSWDMGCADGDNGAAWFDNFCSAASFRLGCPRVWWEAESSAACGGAAAGQPGVPLMQDFAIVEQPANLSTVASRLDDAAVSFILAHADHNAAAVDSSSSSSSATSSISPFFLYYAMPHMHAPQAHAAAFRGSSKSQTVYGDTLREADHSVGRVVQALEQAGRRKDTLLVFTSDNGPWDIKGDWSLGAARGDAACRKASGNALPSAASVGGLAGSAGIFAGLWQRSAEGGGGGATGKFTTWEGGHRVPAIFSWPGRIRPGSTAGTAGIASVLSGIHESEAEAEAGAEAGAGAGAGPLSAVVASHLDLLPTVLALAGVALPPDRAFDGLDLGPVLFESAPREWLGKRTALLHPGDRQTIEAVRVAGNSGNATAASTLIGMGSSLRYKVFFKTCSAAACGEVYYECGHRSNATLVFDLLEDPEEAAPLDPSSSESRVAVAQARQAAAVFRASLAGGLKTVTDFAYGEGPPSWPCADPTQLSCRRLV